MYIEYKDISGMYGTDKFNGFYEVYIDDLSEAYVCVDTVQYLSIKPNITEIEEPDVC